MERLKKKLERVCVLGLLLSAVLTFSQCKKERPRPDDFSSVNGSQITDSQAIVSNTTPVSLDLSNAALDEGFAYKISRNFGITGDSNTQPSISTLRVFEDGKELGAAHSSHASIRTTGKGKFSHWGNSLIFSTSDNSDPRKNGRKYTFTTGGTPSTGAPDPTTPVTPPTTGVVAKGLLGYAAESGSTTGGQGGQTVTVSTLAALKSAASSSSPMIIQVSGTITGTGMINVSSNKSIIGLKGSKLSGVGLLLYTVNNIIIQNMTIEKVVGGDCITIKESSHHIWVDHCDLSSDKDHGWDYYDGLLDITNKSDYVTVSWNKLHDSNIAMLIGAGYTNTDDKGKLRVTLYNNYFNNISERTPDAKFGSVHMFNNYFNQAAYVGAFMGATIRLENNYWKSSNLPIRTDLSSIPGVISGLSTNIFEGSGANRITSSASSWEPTYTYKSSVIAAANVPSVVAAGAGATL
ncbi:pectate lyase [Pedobacter gandavensis]|uniref:pectate lyase family protein n=1 Tax=Pedobacter gandavensis TaxID=2679963 RepID=UPI0029315B02|nr:pectate lyase [Pedobacter gandavensis]